MDSFEERFYNASNGLLMDYKILKMLVLVVVNTLCTMQIMVLGAPLMVFLMLSNNIAKSKSSNDIYGCRDRAEPNSRPRLYLYFHMGIRGATIATSYTVVFILEFCSLSLRIIKDLFNWVQ